MNFPEPILKMKTTLALAILLALSEHGLASVNKWTPADFDWSRIKSYEGVLKQNVSASAPPSKELISYAADKYNMTEADLIDPNVDALGIALGLGWNLRTAKIALQANGLSSTVIGCTTSFTGGGAISHFACAQGIASTLGGIGREYLIPRYPAPIVQH